MTYEKFEDIRSSLKLTSIRPFICKVTKDHAWRSKDTGEISYQLKAGEEVQLYFSETYPGSIFIMSTDRVCISKCRIASKFLTKFRKAPTTKTLEKWSYDGVARSVLNNKVEPDGWDHDGSPSWLLVYGII
jgi:hypothetical protein